MKKNLLLFGLILANLCSVNLHGAKKRPDQTIYEMIDTLSLCKKKDAVSIAISNIIAKINSDIKPENAATIATQLKAKGTNAVNLLITKFIDTKKNRFKDVFTQLIQALDKCNDTAFDEFLNIDCITLALNLAETNLSTKGTLAQTIIEQLIQLKKADRIFNSLELEKEKTANTLLIEVIKTNNPKYLIVMLKKAIEKAWLDHSKILVTAILDAKLNISNNLDEILMGITNSKKILLTAPDFINIVYLPLQLSTGENITNYKYQNNNTIAHILANAINNASTKKELIVPLKNALVELVKQAPLILTITNDMNKTPLSIIKQDATLISQLRSVLPATFDSRESANLLAQFIVINPNDGQLISCIEKIRNKTPQLLTSKTATQASALAVLANSPNATLKKLTEQTFDILKSTPVLAAQATQEITAALAAAPNNTGLREAATHIAITSPELLLPKEGTPSPLKYLAESNEVGAATMLTAIVQAIPSTEASRKQIAKVLLEAKPEDPALAETIRATVKDLIALSPEAERAHLTQTVADAIMQNVDDKSPTSPLIGFAQAFVQDPANPENISILKLISENGLAKKFGDGSNKKSIIDVLVAKISKVEILTLLKEMITKILAKAQSEGKDLSSKENVAGILGMDTLPSALMPEIQPFIAQAITTKELNGKLTQLKTHLTGLKNKLQTLNTKLKDLKGKLAV